MGEWEQEIPLSELDKQVPIYDFPFAGFDIKIHRVFSNKELKKLLNVSDVNMMNRILEIKSRFITMDALFLYEIAKKSGTKFKILYKDLYPGDTAISYDIRVVFE